MVNQSLMENTNPNKQTWFLYGDALRVIATFFVVVIHTIGVYIYTYSNTYPWWILNIVDSFTRIAVPLFLCLSGALLLRTDKEEPIKTFYQKRLHKILIPFLFWSLFYYAISIGFQFNNFPATDFIVKLFQGNIFYHFPFMYYLIGIYLAIPVIRVYTRSAKKEDLEAFLTIWFISEFLLTILPVIGISISPMLFQLAGYIGYPILGYYAKEYAHDSKQKMFLFTGCWIFTVLATYYLSDKSQMLNSTFYEYLAPNVILMTYVAFTWISNHNWTNSILFRGFLGKISLLTSKISFTVYFIHPIILRYLSKYPPHTLEKIISNPVTGLLILSIQTFFISWVFSYLIVSIPELILKKICQTNNKATIQ
jgi:surface polysaccharide O-acyltransferase-like enzyme